MMITPQTLKINYLFGRARCLACRNKGDPVHVENSPKSNKGEWDSILGNDVKLIYGLARLLNVSAEVKNVIQGEKKVSH